MASETPSPESRALRRHSASLIKAIADPIVLSWALFAKEIIEESTRDDINHPNLTIMKSNTVLLSAVMRKVEARPSLFQRLVDLLKGDGDDILRELGGKLETTYKELHVVISEELSTRSVQHSETQIQPSSSSGAAASQPLIYEVERLSVCDLGPPVRAAPVPVPTDSTESQLHPGIRVQWRRCTDCPIEMSKAQAVVVMGEKVYVGGGHTERKKDCNQVFQYNWRGDMWSTLPRCPVRWFGMAHFMGRIITVGGEEDLKFGEEDPQRDEENLKLEEEDPQRKEEDPRCEEEELQREEEELQRAEEKLQHEKDRYSPTSKVYSLREESHKWEEFLSRMPTARYALSLVTTSKAIIAAGGLRPQSLYSSPYSSVVEVYSSDTSQWHTADPLPTPRAWMSSIIIDDTCYLLGGNDNLDGAIKKCWCASLPSLIQKVVSSPPHSDSASVWKQLRLQATPFKLSAAACLDWSLVAIGGINDEYTRSSAVYVFLGNSWVSLRSGDLLPPLSLTATAQLSPVETIVIGGSDEQGQRSKAVLIGTLHSLLPSSEH